MSVTTILMISIYYIQISKADDLMPGHLQILLTIYPINFRKIKEHSNLNSFNK